MGTQVPAVATPAPPKVSWLKKFGSAVWNAAKEVVGFLGSAKVQTLEQQAAVVAELLLPAEAPIIQSFQAIVGKIFKQAATTEVQFTNIANAGPQKLTAVLSAVGPELDQWVESNLPGSGKIQAATKAGLVNAIVAVQNDLNAPVPASAALPSTPTAK